MDHGANDKTTRRATGTAAETLKANSKTSEISSWVVLKFWSIVKVYWTGEERWSALAVLGAIIVVIVIKVYTMVMLNDAGGQFFNAIQSRDRTAFYHVLSVIAMFLFLQLLCLVAQLFMSQSLEIRWRRWLTEHYMKRWLANRAFYQMPFTGRTDNPDQRISEDIRLVTADTLNLGIGFITTTLTVIAFANVLWNVSGPLDLSFKGLSIAIPGYLFWAALLYWLIGSILGYVLGHPLIRLNNFQQRYEADFRFALIRVREKAECIALYGGELQELARSRRLFKPLFANYVQIIRRNAKLLAFQTFLGQGPDVLPFLVVAPRYFSGSLAFGDLMRVGNGFGQISRALSWLVTSFAVFAEWHATVDRLAEFKSELDHTDTYRSGFDVTSLNEEMLALYDVDLSLPQGQDILTQLHMRLKRGESVLIKGKSGSGKSTLFRVIAGIWPFGAGHVQLPKNATLLFLPQKPYIPIGTLRDALWFPSLPDEESDADVRAALDAVGLDYLSNRLGEEAHWEHLLSPGEQQRLAISQAILLKPDWLFLDEATSALDEAQEASVYNMLAIRLPQTTIISIGHRTTLEPFHDRIIAIINIQGDKGGLNITRQPFDAREDAGDSMLR